MVNETGIDVWWTAEWEQDTYRRREQQVVQRVAADVQTECHHAVASSVTSWD